MSTHGRPSFVGEHWLGYQQGLSFSSAPPVDLASSDNLRGSDWMKLLCVFSQAQLGRFGNVPVLLELLAKSRDGDVRAAASRLLGHFGNAACRAQLPDWFVDDDRDVRTSAILAAFYSGDPSLVDPLLHARHILPIDDAEWVLLALSLLLEDEFDPEPVLAANRFLDNDTYETSARRIRDKLATGGGASQAVAGGRILSVGAMLEVIEALARGPDLLDNGGSLSIWIDLFEAFTGTPSTHFFADGLTPQSLDILAAIEDFKEGGKPRSYTPGVRYFFGHRIPD